MEDKRKRTVNFTSDEKSVLTELVIKYRDIIENKKSGATTNAEKASGWKHLAAEFNALSTHCKRTPESLKTCWENIKRQTKKQSASQKRELFKTGGGRPLPPPPNTGVNSMIESILGSALEGLENPYDCDALLDINGKENGATQPTTDEYCYTQMGSNTEDEEKGARQETISTDDYMQRGSNNEYLHSETEMVHVIQIEENEPSCSFTEPYTRNKFKKKDGINTNWDKENNLKWEGCTPNSLKRPISNLLKKSTKDNKDNSWLKRRRPDQQSLSDQLQFKIQEKINLVKTLVQNSQEESRHRILILQEQLKQEKIKTQKLLQ